MVLLLTYILLSLKTDVQYSKCTFFQYRTVIRKKFGEKKLPVLFVGILKLKLTKEKSG